MSTQSPSRVATFGDINIDVVLTVDRLPMPGEEVFSTQRVELLGGSAVNTGVVLARLGQQVGAMGAVGDDEPGRRALSMLQSAGVGVEHTIASSDLPTAMNTVLVTPDGERTMVGARGANIAYSAPPGWQEGISWLHISGYSLMEGTQRATAIEALELAPAIPMSLDVPTGVGGLIGEAIGDRVNRFSVVAGSAASLVELTGSDLPVDFLIDSGVSRVAMTSGAGPILVHDESGPVRLSPPQVDPVDATGAGDALIAGLIAADLAGLDVGPSAVLAAVCGTAATLVRGASETLADPKVAASLLEPALWPDIEPEWLDLVRSRFG